MKLLGLLESLPDRLLDRITLETILSYPPSTLTLLSELGSIIHQSTARTLFETLVLQDDARFISPEFKGPILSILINPAKYGSLVRKLEIVDPVHFESLGTPVHLFETETPSPVATFEILPLHGVDFERTLRALPHLETFIWKATTCPPDGICEILSICNPRLNNFTYAPMGTLFLSSKSGALRWDGLSLPLLSHLSLTTLRLSRLSHVGAKSLSNLLSLLEEDSSLERVSIDTNWLDENICQRLGHVCRKAKRLEFASDGTRLTDSCITTLISLCESLEEFKLGDVQGRLSKTLWEKIEAFPHTLRRFSVSISEATLQHPWAIDHLASLQFLPLSTLTHLSIARISNPFQSEVHEVASVKSVPNEFVLGLQAAKSLRHLTCDWWSWTPEDLKIPMENCHELRSLRVAFDGSFSKLLSSSLPMSNAISLETFAVFTAPENCPTLPPSPATTHRAVSRSPSASPLQHTRRLSVSVGATPDPINEDKTGTSRITATISETGIQLREIRKFVRRSPTLREVTWYGRNGIQGKWNVTRAFATAQSNANLTVEYIPCAALSEDFYDRFLREENAMRTGWSPGTVDREGSIWTGPNAELYHSLRAAEKDSEERQAKEEKAIRMASRKGGISGLAIEMPKYPLKSSTSAPADGPAMQIPSPISPVEPKTFVSPRKSTPRERRHTSASLNSRSNGDGNHPGGTLHQPRLTFQTEPATNGFRESTTRGQGRASGKRGNRAGSEGRPRTETNGEEGTRRSSRASESPSTSHRGNNGRGGKSTRGGRGFNNRLVRPDL